MSPDVGFDLHHEADLIRLYVATWTVNSRGERAADRTRARIFDAVERLEAAARKEAA